MKKNKFKKVKVKINDDKEIVISKATKINMDENDPNFIYLDELKDGTYRLCYTSNLFESSQEITEIKLKR